MPTQLSRYYTGPIDSWRRFMSGLRVKAEHFLTDESVWTVKPMTPYHRHRLDIILTATAPSDEIRERFYSITQGLRL